MPSVNVGEADFAAVAGAAWDAQRRGDDEGAAALDKLARKINAALSQNNPTLRALGEASGMGVRSVSWRDMPSVLDIDTPRMEPKA